MEILSVKNKEEHNFLMEAWKQARTHVMATQDRVEFDNWVIKFYRVANQT